MAPEFGLVVDLTWSLGSPLSDVHIQLLQRALSGVDDVGDLEA
jgi:hypothetical protein